MQIQPFLVEEWMNEYEDGALYNIAETCVDSVSLDELFELTGVDKEAALSRFCTRRMTYGAIWGAPEFKAGICRLYKTLTPDLVIPTHGAAGANHHVFYSLLEPGDEVISIMPTYQQLYSIPESFGAVVKRLPLKPEDHYHVDLDALRALVTSRTKMICINNPNNPTGALMGEGELNAIISVARTAGAYVLCDEVYRHLTQNDLYSPSIADLYEKGISVSSMSKVFSLAGLRLGWIASHDEAFLRSCLSHRDYNLVSCGLFDEWAAGIALAHADVLLARSRGIVRRNLALLDAWVNSQPLVHYVKPEAGTTALIGYDLDLPSRTFCKEMYRMTGAFVTPGDCFEMPFCFRVGYAADTEVLQNGLAAVDAYLSCKLEAGTPLRSPL